MPVADDAEHAVLRPVRAGEPGEIGEVREGIGNEGWGHGEQARSRGGKITEIEDGRPEAGRHKPVRTVATPAA